MRYLYTRLSPILVKEKSIVGSLIIIEKNI
jgi:hypothetical protein